MPRISAVSFHETSSIETKCRSAVACGFDSLELSRTDFYHKLITPGLRKRFVEWSQQQSLNLYGFDCGVEVDPYTRRSETLAEFRRVIDWAADLDLKMIITHDPWAAVNAHRRASQCIVHCVELFRQVAEWCAAKQLQLLFEPHPDTLSMNDSWAIDFLDAVGEDVPHEQVGLVYDCCHYGVGQPENYINAIRKLGLRIAHVHLADGDLQTYGLHLPLGDGTLDLAGIVVALRAINYTGTLANDLQNYPLVEDGARRNAPRVAAIEQQLLSAGDADGAML